MTTQIWLNLHFFKAGKSQKNFALDVPMLFPLEETKLFLPTVSSEANAM